MTPEDLAKLQEYVARFRQMVQLKEELVELFKRDEAASGTYPELAKVLKGSNK